MRRWRDHLPECPQHTRDTTLRSKTNRCRSKSCILVWGWVLYSRISHRCSPTFRRFASRATTILIGNFTYLGRANRIVIFELLIPPSVIAKLNLNQVFNIGIYRFKALPINYTSRTHLYDFSGRDF